MKLLTIANNAAWRTEYGLAHEVRGKCVFDELHLEDDVLAMVLSALGIYSSNEGAVDGRKILRAYEAMQGAERQVFKSLANMAEEAARREEIVVWHEV